MRGELAAQLGHAAFQNATAAFLDDAGQFRDQIRLILAGNSDDELHVDLVLKCKCDKFITTDLTACPPVG